jgi:hypothetical protein
MKKYPDDYKGPKAGLSTQEEWVAVRDYDAFSYVRESVWSYADFDCYLYAMCEKHNKLGGESALKALQEFQKMYNIKTELKPWYEKQ